MSVSKYIKTLLLFLLFSQSLQATDKLIGSIGFISPNYPEFGRYRPSQDIDDFFSDLIESAYYSYGDAGVTVVNRLNMKRGEIIFDDVKYQGHLLLPDDENREYINDFYHKKGIRFKKRVAEENKADILLFSMFHKGKLKKVLSKKSRKSVLMYRIFAYDLQSGSTKSEYIEIEVTDLFGIPDYDPDKLQAVFIKKYIQIFQEILGHMQTIGSAFNKKTTAGAGSTEDSGSGDW